MFSFQMYLVKLLLLSTQATVKYAFQRDKKLNVIKNAITFTDFFINCSHLVKWPA